MCYKNETRVLFDLADFMGSDDVRMTYRIDKAKPKSMLVSVSEGGELFGFWNGTGVNFARSLRGKSRLVVAAKPYNEGLVEAGGPGQVIDDVAKACKWPKR